MNINNSINPNNSPMSFKATLKTPFKTGAMPEITKEFENITKNIKGTLVFDYASSEVKSSGLKEFVYNGISYVTRKANKYINLDVTGSENGVTVPITCNHLTCSASLGDETMTCYFSDF